MEREIACPGSNGDVVLRAESIPFSEIPGQSKLFTQYQNDPLSLKRFYPSAVASHTGIADRIPEVLESFDTDRGILCDALEGINRQLGAHNKSFENIELLRDPDCVAVVTGQQAGLFTGPLYTIYKALSAIRGAECLRGRGFKAVPVFWAATEDHDFEEVSEAFVLDASSHLAQIRSNVNHLVGLPVGRIRLDASIDADIESLFGTLNRTEFSPRLRELVENAWKEGGTFGTAFGMSIAALLSRYGLVLLDPLHKELKRLASPVYLRVIERADEIVEAVRSRNDELISAGYEAQVAVTEDHFPLFWHSDDGKRIPLRRASADVYKAKEGGRDFHREELKKIAANEPERLSPNVLVRSAVQDHILPTVCYFGGGAEVAYFAQNSEVYRILDRPVTTILHRQSFTVVESKHSRTLNAYGLGITDLFRGLEALLPEIVDMHLDRNTAKTFGEVEEVINTQLNRLDRELSAVDTTLAENLATRRRKIIYHIGALRSKFRKVQLKKDETIDRRVESLFEALLPNGGLQERKLNITYFINRYGPRFIDWMYNAADLDDRSHRVIYL